MFVRTTAAAAGLTLSAALLISPWTVSATGVTPAVARADWDEGGQTHDA